jgi:hypothetical protein
MPPRRGGRHHQGSRKPKGPVGDAAGPVIPRTTVSIDRHAGVGRSDLRVGDQVRIVGSGLYAGETAVIERMTGSVVPAAFVRTDGGRTRQVRTIDLEPVARSTGRTGSRPDAPASDASNEGTTEP